MHVHVVHVGVDLGLAELMAQNSRNWRLDLSWVATAASASSTFFAN